MIGGILFTGSSQFLRRHRLLIAAIERQGFATATLSLRERRPATLLRYAASAGKVVVPTAFSAGPRPLRDRMSLHALKTAYDLSPEAFAFASRQLERTIGSGPKAPDFVVHIFALSSPFFERRDVPFAHYLDYTGALGARAGPFADPAQGDGERRRFLALERRSFEAATVLFAMSRLVRDSLVADYEIPPEKIVVTGAGPNIAPLGDLRKTFGSRTLLFNASDFSLKGGELVFDAFALLRAADARVRLITVGAALPAAYRGREGVEERGAVRAEGMRELFGDTDLLLSPSGRDAFPGIVIEAMAHGTPAIVRSRDGMPEIVSDGVDGVVLDDADATGEGLAATIRSLLDDEPRLRALGDAARATVAERLNWDAVAAKMAPFLPA